MDTGVISSRYASALLKLVDENGRGEQVCAQVKALLADPDVARGPLEPELEHFVALLVDHHRTDYMKQIFTTFVRMYYKKHNIVSAHLTTAAPSAALEEKIRSLFKDCEVVLDTKVDPSILGGFILEVDDMMMDTSVSHELDKIRRQFIDKNRRIV